MIIPKKKIDELSYDELADLIKNMSTSSKSLYDDNTPICIIERMTLLFQESVKNSEEIKQKLENTEKERSDLNEKLIKQLEIIERLEKNINLCSKDKDIIKTVLKKENEICIKKQNFQKIVDKLESYFLHREQDIEENDEIDLAHRYKKFLNICKHYQHECENVYELLLKQKNNINSLGNEETNKNFDEIGERLQKYRDGIKLEWNGVVELLLGIKETEINNELCELSENEIECSRNTIEELLNLNLK